MRNITLALGGTNETDSDIEDIIKFEEKLATVLFYAMFIVQLTSLVE